MSAAAAMVALANAGELSAGQRQTIAIPKRVDLAAKPAGIDPRPVTLDGLKAGDALRGPDAAGFPPAPLSGLSLDNLSLAPASPADPQRPSDSEKPALTGQHGNIRYSVAPNSGFTPYLGLGAGRAAGMVGSGMSNSYDANDGLHSYQGVAGFAYRLDKDTRLDFDYRMSNTQRPDVPMLNNADIADAERDRAAILSFHYDLAPVLPRPPK